MQILAFFTDEGVPKTGLIPIIRIRDISDNTLIISDSTSEEVGDGWYKYDFIQYDSNKEYAIRFDGGSSLQDTDRYTSGTNDSFVEDIVDGVFEEQMNKHIKVGSFGYTIGEINTNVKRALGLMHHNIFIDQTVYDAYGNMKTARVRIYSSSSSVGGNNDVIGTYIISSSSSETGKFDRWSQVEI